MATYLSPSDAQKQGIEPGSVEWYQAMGITSAKEDDRSWYEKLGDAGGSALDKISGVDSAEINAAAADAASQRAQDQAAAAQEYMGQQVDVGREYLSQAQDQAQYSLHTGNEAAKGYLQGGNDQALGALSGGYDKAAEQLSGQPNRMADLYGGGLGAGFAGDPGYQFRLKQGQDAINAQSAAAGGRHGGDTMKALAEYNQNFASNEFGNYAQRQMGLAGAADQGDAARNNALAQLYQGQGQQTAGIYGNQGSQLAGMASQYGGANAALYQGYGQSQANLGIGAATNNTSLSQTLMGQGANPYAGAASGAEGNFYGGLVANIGGRILDRMSS